jgi:hypothetical protein
MSEQFTVIVSTPDADGAVAGALAGRAVEGRAEALVFDSADLVAFFRPDLRQKLPRRYNLILCGPSVVHTDWEGRSVRPALMDALRAIHVPVRWFSGRRWDPEDRRAVAHLIGEGALRVSDGATSAAELVCREMCAPSDAYADLLVRFVSGELGSREEESWGATAMLVLCALKTEPEQMAAAIALMMEERIDEMNARFGETARRTDEENRTEGRRQAAKVLRIGSVKVVLVTLAEARQPFWAEVSGYARREAEAELSVCALSGRSVLLVGRERNAHLDLEGWVRYLTDMLPGTERVGEQPDAVAVHVPGLAVNPGLRDEVLRFLQEGAHLLRR